MAEGLTQAQWRKLGKWVLHYFANLADELKAGTAKFERRDTNVGLDRANLYDESPDQMLQWTTSWDGEHYLEQAVAHVANVWLYENLANDRSDQFQQQNRERAYFLREHYYRRPHEKPFNSLVFTARQWLKPQVREILRAKGGVAAEYIVSKAVESESRYLHAIYNLHD